MSGILLEIFQDLPGLVRGKVSPHAHVNHDRLPLPWRELRGIALRVAPIAVDGIQVRTRKSALRDWLFRSGGSRTCVNGRAEQIVNRNAHDRKAGARQ